jgi:hypothetical protein
VMVYDAAGRVVDRQYTNATRITLSITALSPGIYTITVSDGAHTILRKFVKQ